MSSAAEAELAALYMTAKEMVSLRQTLIAMGWPQPKSLIKVDNTTAVGVTNKTLVPKQTKSMDMGFYWLRFRMTQGQFHVYWAPGPSNEADYTTKHHPPPKPFSSAQQSFSEINSQHTSRHSSRVPARVCI